MGVVVLAGAAAAWVALRGLSARAAVQDAQAAAERTRAALVTGDDARARAELAQARAASERGRRLVGDPVFAAAARLPVVGPDVAAVRAVVRAVDEVADRVLAPAVEVGGVLRSLEVSGGRIDLAPIERAAPVLAAAARSAERISASVTAIDRRRLSWRVAPAVADAQTALADLTGTTAQTSTVASLLPAMLGANDRRRYFLAFQNNAEARGTGGLLGAYGVLEAYGGRLKLLSLGSNTDLQPATRMPIELGEDFERLYNDDAALWVNANLSPHFPYAARIWLALWEQQRGQRLDGVIATDPVAMSYVLRATGPVRLPDGSRVDASNAVSLTLRDVYARFPEPGANGVRDAYLQRIARGMFAKLLAGGADPEQVARSLQQAAAERRLLVYSGVADEQAKLAATTVGGALPGEPGPYAALAVNNAGGNKLDYYLERELAYSSRCSGAGRTSRIRATLTNTAPRKGLPDYVVLRVDQGPGATSAPRQPRGTNVGLVQVYAARDAELVGARLDGKRILVVSSREEGHAVYQARVALRPGQSRTLELDLREPAVDASKGGVAGFEQPLVKDATIRADVRSCGQ